MLGVSVWASGWQRYTWGARIGVVACALGVLTAGVASLPGDREPAAGLRRGDLAWLAVIAVAAAWDVLALLTPPGRHHLTLSATELADRPLHAVLFALWLAVGTTLAATPLRPRRRDR
ncbi:MAG TPA: hypothetical protein VHA57_01530 [Actinomycetota bacterium]|nr:hypothetical protein [Actinomycetota bacterium]